MTAVLINTNRRIEKKKYVPIVFRKTIKHLTCVEYYPKPMTLEELVDGGINSYSVKKNLDISLWFS